MSAKQARAGVVVTGTEVLTGRDRDRNGPWLAERLGELGVEVVATCCSSATAPTTSRPRCASSPTQGVDLIVTSGGLGPDRRRPHGRDRRLASPGRELVLDEAMEERIAAILAGFARRMKFDAEALRDANRKQAMVPEGATTIDPAGTAPGLVVPVDGGPTVDRDAGPTARAAGDVAAGARDGAGPRRARRAPSPSSESSMRMFGIPESEIAQTLREIEEDTDLSALEITTCLRRAELVVDVRRRPGSRRDSRAPRRAPRRRPRAPSSSATTARRSTSRSPSCW